MQRNILKLNKPFERQLITTALAYWTARQMRNERIAQVCNEMCTDGVVRDSKGRQVPVYRAD